MEPARTIDGWAADTTRPLGPLPFLGGSICAAIFAIAFASDPVAAGIAWAVFAGCVIVLVGRAIRWTSRQLEAVQIERQTDELLEREPRLVPLFHPPAHDPREYHKAS